jgi:hypothetical protein
LFWSLSEIIDDLKSHSEEEVIQLVQNGGKASCCERLGDDTIDFNHMEDMNYF